MGNPQGSLIRGACICIMRQCGKVILLVVLVVFLWVPGGQAEEDPPRLVFQQQWVKLIEFGNEQIGHHYIFIDDGELKSSVQQGVYEATYKLRFLSSIKSDIKESITISKCRLDLQTGKVGYLNISAVTYYNDGREETTQGDGMWRDMTDNFTGRLVKEVYRYDKTRS